MLKGFLYIGKHLNPRTYWRLRFRNKGKLIYTENFYASEYGSSDNALIAAINKRQKVAEENGIDIRKLLYTNCNNVKPYRYVQTKIGPRNKSGVIGVAYYESKSDGKTRRYYRASISLKKNKEKVKSFNCDVLGEHKAFCMAVAKRKKWEKKLKDKNGRSDKITQTSRTGKR